MKTYGIVIQTSCKSISNNPNMHGRHWLYIIFEVHDVYITKNIYILQHHKLIFLSNKKLK